MSELQRFIRTEFQKKIKPYLLWNALLICNLDFAWELLLQNPEKINWEYLSRNPSEWVVI